ncbi:MAG: transglutaminase domain-containing protein, partial [Anaerolineales bacterium]|nr:transglutaminase domain-containing protein [Anaerolineales bacterium]
DHGASSYLPQDRLLGGRPDLLDEVVMQVWTDEPAPLPEGFAPMTDFGTQTPPHYWQGLVFDRYTGRGWSASVNERTEVQGNLPLAAPTAYRGVTQRFQLVAPHGTTLYSLSSPVWIEQQVEALWRIAPPMQVSDELTGTTTAGADLAGLSSPIVTYTVLSHIPEPTASALRRAPAEYPPEVAEIYLQLPETVPMRVIDLAQKVVTEGDSAYEQARLLEAYLRQYPYTLDVEAPPEERDVADYFLFDLREGYCDYYATAFVVMARAVGIPSRLVSGYVGGGFDFNTESYVVRHYNGHSWPEVYFPGWGWVSFEPTGSQPVRELREEAVGSERVSLLPPAGPPARVVRFRWRAAALSTLGLALAVLLATRMSAYVRRRRPALTLPYLWLQLGRAGARVGVQPDPALTPYEYAALLSRELRARAERVSWRRAFWQDQARRTSLALARLAMMYSEQTYRGRVAPLRQVALRSAWRRLQVALSRFGWLVAWQRLGDRLTGKAEETS